MIEVKFPSGQSARLDAMPLDVDRRAFVSAFLDAREMRRLFTGTQSRQVAESLGLEVRREPEAETCRRIEAYWKGEKP